MELPKVQDFVKEQRRGLILTAAALFFLLFAVLLNFLTVNEPGPFNRVLVLLNILPMIVSFVIGFLPLFPVLLAVAVLSAASIAVLDARVNKQYDNKKYRQVLLVSFCICALSVVALLSLNGVRHQGFVALAERSKPLVAAIQAYEIANGKAPEKLQQLVPKYLPFVPGTGMGLYPNYQYQAYADQSGSGWSLRVSCPLDPLNGDEFFYSPKSKTPAAAISRYNEQIGDWVYVHE